MSKKEYFVEKSNYSIPAWRPSWIWGLIQFFSEKKVELDIQIRNFVLNNYLYVIETKYKKLSLLGFREN